MRRDGVSTSDESRSDLRLAKAKVAGSNPVFRSKSLGPTSESLAGLFFRGPLTSGAAFRDG